MQTTVAGMVKARESGPLNLWLCPWGVQTPEPTAVPLGVWTPEPLATPPGGPDPWTLMATPLVCIRCLSVRVTI